MRSLSVRITEYGIRTTPGGAGSEPHPVQRCVFALPVLFYLDAKIEEDGDAEEALDRFGLLENTSVLVTREDAALKPDPGPVILAMERLGVESAWFIGDTPDDVEAARSAGALPIGVIAPGADPERTVRTLSRTARVLAHTVDLEELLT